MVQSAPVRQAGRHAAGELLPARKTDRQSVYHFCNGSTFSDGRQRRRKPPLRPLNKQTLNATAAVAAKAVCKRKKVGNWQEKGEQESETNPINCIREASVGENEIDTLLANYADSL